MTTPPAVFVAEDSPPVWDLRVWCSGRAPWPHPSDREPPAAHPQGSQSCRLSPDFSREVRRRLAGDATGTPRPRERGHKLLLPVPRAGAVTCQRHRPPASDGAAERERDSQHRAWGTERPRTRDRVTPEPSREPQWGRSPPLTPQPGKPFSRGSVAPSPPHPQGQRDSPQSSPSCRRQEGLFLPRNRVGRTDLNVAQVQ